MDELIVAWSRAVTRTGRDLAEHVARGVTGRELKIVYGCRTCGSKTHGAPYFTDGWSAFLGCSITYVPGLVLAVLSVRRRQAGDHHLLRGALTVGIDAEDADTGYDLLAGVAWRVLNDSETGRLAQVKAADAPAAVVRAWTEKEAVLKAAGWGLNVDPRNVTTRCGTLAHTSRAEFAYGGRIQRFRTRAVTPTALPKSFLVSLATVDTPRARRAAVNVVPAG